MAGDKNIYVVYDPKIEDSSSLSKFLGIVLEKAQYPIKDVEFVTLPDYLKLLETQGPRNFTICLNKTYSDISLKYGAILEEATFKFFSRFYQNPEKKIAILGLLMDVHTIFDDENSKKNAWGKIVTLQKFYEEHKKGMTQAVIQPERKEVETKVESDQEYLDLTNVEDIFEEDDGVPEVIKSSEDIRKEEVLSTPVKKSLTIRDAITEPEKISYDDLLAFYKLASGILVDIASLKTLSEKIGKTL